MQNKIRNKSLAARALEGFTEALGFRKPANNERRKASRLPGHAGVLLLVPGDHGEDVRIRANVVDIAPGGLAVRSSKGAEPGAAVRIKEAGAVLDCIVRRVTPEGKEFILGLEIQSSQAPEDARRLLA
ncbi:MAG: PilZ domain-containing protein [Bryobacterales bacterium]|nr:PilZ domain-containing protein [Acidobacteriota bacterium]MCB9384044.1 PilZ domain-containing protein [Bryobacterales bacterium]